MREKKRVPSLKIVYNFQKNDKDLTNYNSHEIK